MATAWTPNLEIPNSGKKRHRVGSIVKEFGLNTSTHGIPGIARSESTHNRIFWIVCLLIFFGIMVYFVTEAILAYFTYPTQTSVSIILEWPQAFPALTVCNYSPFRYDRFIGPFLNYTNMRNLTNTTDTSHFTVEQSHYIQDFLTYKLNQNESLNDLFYSLDSMMMYCNYNGMSCEASNFTWFISPNFGLCYTFNALLKTTGQDGLKYNADNGSSGILQLRFYVHQHQYVPYLSNGVGMAILVHDNIQLPIIELATMYLSPGKHHRLGYAKKSSIFLPAPYTTCNQNLTLGMKVMFNEYHDTDYGYALYPCYLSCIQAYTYQKCGCGHPFRWNIRSIVLPNTDKIINIPLCDLKNPCYNEATTEIMNTQSIWTTFCPDCTQECSYSEFIITSSSLSAPPQFLMNDIKAFVESSQVPLPVNWSTTWTSEIQASYVSLEVAYETTRTEVYSQQATIGIVDVISNVGGNTGLWIGISFLSLMELAEMLYRLIRSLYQSSREAKRTAVVQP
ncbi:unnamed protein product [Adineta ricciae]|uniref:Uncharacterized protein n=1 Tax=Adineta ricciae TaxID=249248 RepID=A0A813Q6M0_ADIRI|nr:unnamed protein product [Adineta ricciae]